MSKKQSLAVVGATGAVGTVMLDILSKRENVYGEIRLIASAKSAGKKLICRGEELTVVALSPEAFEGIDIAMFDVPDEISKEWAPIAASKGAVVVDNSGAFRMDKDVPLVVPEVNADAIADYTKRNIIANPNCSTIQMVTALKPLHDIARIKRIVVSTYQSVSGAGKGAMDELYNQTRAILMNTAAPSEHFSKPIAFNVIPQIDVFMDDGSTKEEWKMQVETKKILDAGIEVSATCVRVPVFVGHAEAVNVEFESPISVAEARVALQEADGIWLMDNLDEYGFMTPKESSGQDPVYVSRIRKDPTVEHGLNLWIVADNVRKGAALNSVQIAEVLIENYL